MDIQLYNCDKIRLMFGSFNGQLLVYSLLQSCLSAICEYQSQMKRISSFKRRNVIDQII